MIGWMSFVAIALFNLLQIQLLHRTMHEKPKMSFAQHFSHRWWQQVSLLRVVLQKIGHPALLLSRQYRGSVKPSCHTDSYTSVATGSTRNLLKMVEILALRGARDGRNGWLREYTRGCGGKEGRAGDTVSNLGLENTASVTICQVRNKDCELNGLRMHLSAKRKERVNGTDSQRPSP